MPVALLQYESHGERRSSPCSLNTQFSWWLVTSSERSKVSVSLLEAPSCFFSGSQSPRLLCPEHTLQGRLGKEQSRRGALKFLVDEAGFIELCLRRWCLNRPLCELKSWGCFSLYLLWPLPLCYPIVFGLQGLQVQAWAGINFISKPFLSLLDRDFP